MKSGRRMHSRERRLEPLIGCCLVGTVLCSFLAATSRGSTLSRLRDRSDGTEKKQKPQAPRTAGRRRTNTITVLHNMQGVLKRLTPCQKEVARLPRWNKLGLTEVRQSSCSRQNHASPTWHIPSPAVTLSTSILLSASTPSAVFPTSCVWGLFLPLISVC